MTNRSQDRSLAEALQEALERREALLAGGAEPSEAQASATRGLGREAAALFALAGALSDAAAPVPEPKHVDVFAERLRRAAAGAGAKAPRRVLWPRRWQLPGLGMAAAAAAIAIFAGILVPAFRSLPGDSLYSLKRASEQSRLAIVGGSDEGRLRLRLAALRYNEVEGLIERAETSGAGPGLAAASSVANITDPRIVELIEETLEDAKEQIEAAATILIAEPPDVQSLDDLVEVSQRGQQLAEDVAGELPAAIKPPVLSTVVTLARIEAKAKAKRTEVAASQPEPTPPPQPQPCATPTPTPTSAADEDASATAEPRTSSTPEPTATAAPTVTPEPTPCITPEPTPTPTASPTPSPTPFVTPTPSPAQSPTPPAEARRQRPETTRSTSPEPTPTGRSFWA